MKKIDQIVESLIFSSDHHISNRELLKTLHQFDETVDKASLDQSITRIQDRYLQDLYSFNLVELAGGYTFVTKTDYHDYIGTHLRLSSKKKLSKSALETLSIIAYNQNVTKSEMESIRGVSCDYTIQKLLEKELITISGRAETPGRPLLYSTTSKFMDHFGISHLRELPKLKDIFQESNTIGEEEKIITAELNITEEE